MTATATRRCSKCGTPEGANLGVCSFGGYCEWTAPAPRPQRFTSRKGTSECAACGLHEAQHANGFCAVVA